MAWIIRGTSCFHAVAMVVTSAFCAFEHRSASADPPVKTASSGGADAGSTPVYDPAWARVRIFANDPRVALERRLGSLPGDPQRADHSSYELNELTWKVVCTAPCNAAVPVGGEYRIGGQGVVASDSIAIRGPYAHLLVDPGLQSVRRAGAWLTVIGFLGAVGGGIGLGVQAGGSGLKLGAGADAAIAALAAGGAIGLTGLGLLGGSTTSVRDEDRRELAFLPPPRLFGPTLSF